MLHRDSLHRGADTFCRSGSTVLSSPSKESRTISVLERNGSEQSYYLLPRANTIFFQEARGGATSWVLPLLREIVVPSGNGKLSLEKVLPWFLEGGGVSKVIPTHKPKEAVYNDSMDARKEKIVITVALVVVIALAFWYFWYRSIGGEVVRPVGPGQEIVRPIREGRIVSGFPLELVSEKNIRIRDSYAMRYEEPDLVQRVLEYESSLSFEENIGAYYDVLTSYNWEVVQLANPYESPSSYHAVLGDRELDVVFQLRDGNVSVIVSHLSRT